MPSRKKSDAVFQDRLLPVWHAPHRLQRPYAHAGRGGHWQTEDLFTFALALPAVALTFAPLRPAHDLSKPGLPLIAIEERVSVVAGPTRLLAEHLGYFELEQFARDVTGELAAEPPVFGGAFLGPTPPPAKLEVAPLPVELVEAFVARYGRALGSFVDQIAHLASDVIAAADSGTRVPVGRVSWIVKLRNEYAPATQLRRFAQPGKPRTRPYWAHVPMSLLGRILIEAEQLALERPPLARCQICGRIFVPFAREAHCRGHLWVWPNGPVRALCRRDADFVIERQRGRSRTEHERERDNTYQRLRRLKRDHASAPAGPQRENLARMIEALEEQRRAQLKQRGPKTTTPIVTQIDLPKGENDGKTG